MITQRSFGVAPMVIDQSYIKKIVFGFVLLHFALLCLALFANTSFATPVADDIMFSRLAHEGGVVSFIAQRYQVWNGRYAADMTFAILYRLFNIQTAYALALCIPIASALIGYMYMLRSLLWFTNTKLKHEPKGLFLTYWLLWFALTALFYTGQSVYALNGSVTYLLGSSLALIFVIGMVRSTVKPRREYSTAQYVITVAGYAIYSFFVSGFNESLMLMVCVVVACGSYWVIRYRREHLWLWGGALLANIGGIYTVTAAPGNSVRVDILTDSSAIDSLVQSTPLIEFIPTLIINTGIVSVLLLGVYLVIRSLPILGSYVIRLEDFFVPFARRQPRSWHIFVAVAYLALIGAGVFVVVFIREGLGARRVRDGIYYFALPFIPFCMSYWRGIVTGMADRIWLLRRLRGAKSLRVARPIVASISAVLFVVLFFGNFEAINNDALRTKIAINITGAPVQLLIDGYSRGRAYANSVRNREEALISAKQAGTVDVTVFPLCTIATSIHYESWDYHRFGYPNLVFARYYGVNSIRQVAGGCH